MNYLRRWVYWFYWQERHRRLLSAGFQGDFKKIRRQIEPGLTLSAPVSQAAWPTYLYQLVRKHRPKTVLEIGVQRGCSTFAFLKGLHDNDYGELHSIDIVPDVFFHRLVAPVVPNGLKDRWHYYEGDSAIILPKVLEEFETVDMAFHDAVHELNAQFKELQMIWDKGTKVLLVDYIGDNLSIYSSKINPRPTSTTYDYGHDGIYPIGTMLR